MDESADAGTPPVQRVLGRLPKITVTSRAQMSRLLRRYRWLLDQQARRYLGDTPHAIEAVERTEAKMLSFEHPNLPHALGRVNDVLRDECRLVRRQLDRRTAEDDAEASRAAGIPYDPVLGRLDDAQQAALRALKPAEQAAMALAVQGKAPAEIGALLGVTTRTAQMRLYRARKRIRAAARPAGGAIVLLRASQDSLRSRFRQLQAAPVTGRLADALRIAAKRAAASMHVAGIPSELLAAAGILIFGSASVPVAPFPSVTAVVPSVEDFRGASAGLHLVDVGRPVTGGQQELVQAPVRLPLGLTTSPLLGPPGEDTPDDAEIVSAARSREDHRTVVALGLGHRCSCWALFRTQDGGRSWAATPAPIAARQVALPPAYPRDPRIFVGTDPQTAGALQPTAPMMTPQFGAAFVPISSLLPAGNVTLSGGFDDGDPRAFVAAMSSVVSYALGSASVDLVATYPPIGQAAPVETASDRDGAVIALLPPDSAVVGIPTMNATSGGASQVVSCGRVGGCTVMTSIRVPGRAGLAVSPTLEVDHLLLVYGASTLFVSADAGRSFRVLALPGQATIMSAAMAASNAWLVTQTGGDVRVRRITPAAASWPEGARDISPPLGKSGRVLALDESRLLYLASGQGYLCSLDGGSSWTTGCPA